MEDAKLKIAVMAVLFIVVGVVSGVALRTSADLQTAVDQRRDDLLLGCERSAKRISAEVLVFAGDAIGDGRVAGDPGQPKATRLARAADAQTTLEGAAELATTLVDCAKAYPKSGEGKSVVNVKALAGIRAKLEARFGEIDPAVVSRFREEFRAAAD